MDINSASINVIALVSLSLWVHTPTHTYTPTHLHTYTHTHLQIYAHAYTHTWYFLKHSPVSVFHTRIVLSVEPEYSMPSGPKRRQETVPVCP